MCGGEWQTSFKWEAFSGCLGHVRAGEQHSAQGKAAGNFGCSVFGKMQPLPLTVSTPVPVGHLFRAEVQRQRAGYPQLQWMQWNKESAIKREVLCSTESSGKRVEGCILKGYLSFHLNQTQIVLMSLF